MLGLYSCGIEGKSPYTDMDVKDFADFISGEGVQLLDVRTPEEFAEGHLAGARNIDIFNNHFVDDATAVLDPARPVAVYCRSGKRSADAARLLSEKGYRVTNLNGGILAWIEDGEPVEK